MSTIPYQTITHCRICDSTALKPIIDLGKQPPANSLRTNKEEALLEIPLAIVRCDACSTVQLTVTIDPDYLFKDYVWVTGTSATANEYSQYFYQQLRQRCHAEKLFAVEIASNDGTFLKRFKDGGHKVLGVDPAENIAHLANEQGVETIADFFGLGTAKKVVETHGKANCVFARNVIPHVADVHDVIAGIAHCLSDDGTGAIEFHYAQIILDELHYDSIYHEHLFYYSLASIQHLLGQHGLFPFDITTSPISGGSLVLYFSKTEQHFSDTLKQKIAEEEANGLAKQAPWDQFSEISFAHRETLNRLLNTELAEGAKVIGYGASARSSTLLNFCGINHQQLTCIADQNPIKHQKYTPSTDILIVSPEKAFAQNPDAVLLLAWNFKDELLTILKEKFQFQGKVILPLPNDPVVIEL